MPPPNKPTTTPTTDTPPVEVPTITPPKVEQQPPDQSAELKKVTAERDALKTSMAKTNTTIRKLAAAILTPPEEADRGVARSQAIRENLLKLVDAIAPE